MIKKLGKLTIQCELCYDWVSLDLIRFYKYEDEFDEEVKYVICEDCVIHHKKHKLSLGIEIGNYKIDGKDITELMKKNWNIEELDERWGLRS